MAETPKCCVKKQVLAAVLFLLLFCFIPGPRPAFPWPSESSNPSPVALPLSHETLCEAAYDALLKDPALRPDPAFPPPVFPARDAIVAQAGGPDKDRSVPYSHHVFNPTFMSPQERGSADTAVRSIHRELSDRMLKSYGQAFEPAEAAKAAAWLAHYVQDLTSPYHVLGMAGTHILSRTIDSKVTGPQPANHRLSVSMNNLIARYQQDRAQHPNADWFDPWYYDGKGNTLAAWIAGSSHMVYESLPSHAPPPPARGYSAFWSQGMTTPQTFAQRIAQRTRATVDRDLAGDIFKAQTGPSLELVQQAVDSTYTAWRSSFSALRLGNVTISPTPATGVYVIKARVKNFDTKGSASNMKLLHTVRDSAGKAVGSDYEEMTGVLSPGQERDTPEARITIPHSARVLMIELMGELSDTPDAGVTQRSYDAQQLLGQAAAARGAADGAAGGTASLTLTKRAIPPACMAGQVFNYIYRVRNTGTVRLTRLRVEDDTCIPVDTVTPGMADKPLDPGSDREFYCDMKLFSRTTNRAVAKAVAPDGAEVSSAPATFTVNIAPPGQVMVPHVLRLTLEAAGYKIEEAGLQVGQVLTGFDDSVPVGEVIRQNPDPDTVPVVAVGSAVDLLISLGPQQQVLRIIVKPPSARLTVGQSVAFTAEVLFVNTGWQVVPVTWIPGNPFTCATPGPFIIRALLQGVDGIANVTCDADWSVPPFEPPVTGAGDRGRVPPAGPGEYKWYAFCEPRSGEVTYGEHLLTGRKIMAGPFPGPRTAFDWINSNCPRWRCDAGGACAMAPRPGQGGEWKVFCGQKDLVVYLGKTYDPTIHILIQEGFLGEPDARAWVNQYYPGWLCTQTGAAALGPRMGGSWAVVCSRKHGGVSMTQHPNPIDYYVWGRGFLGEPDARAWTQRNCPSWRCDAQGRCLIGAVQRMTEGPPLELPPDTGSEDWGRRFSEGFAAGAREGAERGGPGPSPVETRDGLSAGGSASPSSPEKPRPDKPSAQGVDCRALRDEYFKKCAAMREPYVKKNCTPTYSDCANVPRGCYGYVISGALPDGRSPARVGCGRGVADTYIGCLRNCNEQLIAKKLNMFSIEGCGFACRDRAVEAIKACDAGNR